MNLDNGETEVQVANFLHICGDEPNLVEDYDYEILFSPYMWR